MNIGRMFKMTSTTPTCLRGNQLQRSKGMCWGTSYSNILEQFSSSCRESQLVYIPRTQFEMRIRKTTITPSTPGVLRIYQYMTWYSFVTKDWCLIENGSDVLAVLTFGLPPFAERTASQLECGGFELLWGGEKGYGQLGEKSVRWAVLQFNSTHYDSEWLDQEANQKRAYSLISKRTQIPRNPTNQMCQLVRRHSSQTHHDIR